MKFTVTDIKHIADLARLELTPEELADYGRQLSDITAYIDQLQLVQETPAILAPVLQNVWRQDEVREWCEEENEQALGQSDRDGGLIKVKRVL